MRKPRPRLTVALLLPLAGAAAATATATAAGAAALPPLARVGYDAGRFSERTRVLAIEIDRDQARLLAYTVKDRPFVRPLQPPPVEAYEAGGGRVQVEVVLLAPGGGGAYVERVMLGPLCLDHPGDAPPHLEGADLVLLHRDTLLVELPEVSGLDQVEIAYHRQDGGSPWRQVVGFESLDSGRLADIGSIPGGSSATATSGQVHWPEEYGDPDRYTVYGNEAEANERINLVIVPDGYVYAEKAQLQAHAGALVDYFRGKTPYKEHDPFLNYILVYAYSNQSGTDQCDCAIVKDTAMSTRFPDAGGACGDSVNRCLYYGTGNGGPDCDPNTSETNIALAELRAPARDQTVVMVNTSRYGGCGGSRAVYAAAAPSATDIAVHELGHSLADLRDEYGGNTGCGSGSGYNVSTDGGSGNWPEWIGDLGAPRESARYYNQCVFRPAANCDMQSLNQPFCRVCSQRWALVYFGHARVSPTAPVRSQTPASPVTTTAGVPTDFSLVTRLASGAGVTNDLTWKLQGPGYPMPTVVGTGSPSLRYSFVQTGTYTLTCDVVADTNFIKPAKYGANLDVASWTVTVLPSTCDPAPGFAGLDSAADTGACARSGVALGWSPASFGPAGGAYEVWRDGGRVAGGIAASPFVDTPGDGTTHVYRVHAVTSDCSIAEGNTVDRPAADAAGDAAPAFAGVAAVADRDPCSRSGIEVTWSAAAFGPSGGRYDGYRDGIRVATGVASPWVDLPGDGAPHSYRVLAVSGDCGRDDGNAVAIGAADAAADPPPSFAGVQAARDLDPCLASGVELGWDPAGFGPQGGLYDVWRDGVLVASDAGTRHVDQPGDTAVHSYRVTARSACGLSDGNSVAIAAADAAADPSSVPLGLGNRLSTRRAGDDLVLAWASIPEAATYLVYRSDDRAAWPPAADRSGLTATATTYPAEVPAGASLRSYRVSAVNCAGREGP